MTKITDDFIEWVGDDKRGLSDSEMTVALGAWKASALVEREACAKVCQTVWNTSVNEEEACGEEYANAIRAMGNN
jgi:hypothetical protein